MKRYIYLISPQRIREVKFYKELHQVLKTNKVKYFQLRLKKISTSNLLTSIESVNLKDQQKILSIEKATHEDNYTEEELFDLFDQ